VGTRRSGLFQGTADPVLGSPGINPGIALTFFVRNHADGFHLVGRCAKRRNTPAWGFIFCRTDVSCLWLKLPWERVII